MSATSTEDMPKVVIDVEETVCAGEPPYEEDSRLSNWRKWINRHGRVRKRLGEARGGQELLIDACEGVRRVREEKEVLENAQAVPEADPQRGCPSFWTFPPALQPDPCAEPIYFSQPSKLAGCEMPDMEYVHVPNSILQEKGTHSKRDMHAAWDVSEYKKARMHELSTDMKRAEPHRPEMDELMIRGESLMQRECAHVQEEDRISEQPEEVASSPSEATVYGSESVQDVDPVFAVNDFHFYDVSDGTKEIRVIFDYDYGAKTVCTNYLKLKNASPTRAIRVSWQRCAKFNMFADIRPSEFEQTRFAFDRNVRVILPNRTAVIPVHFKPPETGRFQENWRMITAPPVAKNLILIVELVGISFDHDYHDRCQMIDKKLDIKVRQSVIDDALNSAIEGAEILEEPTTFNYDKARIFEAVNSNFDAVQTESQYVYDRGIVEQLSALYAKVRRSYHSEVWNLNIEYLKYVTQERDIYDQCRVVREMVLDEVENESKLPEAAADVVNAFLPLPTTCKDKGGKGKGKGKNKDKGKKDKPTKEKKDKKDKKGSKDKAGKKGAEEPINQEAEWTNEPVGVVDCRPYTKQLNMILEGLMTTLTFPNARQRERQAFAVSLFAIWLNKLCASVDTLKARLNIDPPSNYPEIAESAVPVPEMETFDETFPPRQVFVVSLNLRDRPPAEVLKNIPLEDCDRRYRAYFNIPEEAATSPDKKSDGKKGKKEKKDKKSKPEGKKKDKKGKKGEKKPAVAQAQPNKPAENPDVNLDFDPYKEAVQLPPALSSEEIPVEVAKAEAPKGQRISLSYRYNLFFLFYVHLEGFVTDLLEFLDEEVDKTTRPADVKKVEMSNDVVLENMQRTRSKLVNLDMMTQLLINDEDLSEVKERIAAGIRSRINPELNVDPPELNPYIKIDTPLTSLSKSITVYEQPEEKPKRDKQGTYIRKSPEQIPLKRDVSANMPEVEEPPFSKEADAQTCSDDNRDLITKVVDFEIIPEVVKSGESKEIVENKEFLSCTPSSCAFKKFGPLRPSVVFEMLARDRRHSQQSKRFFDQPDSKMQLIDRILQDKPNESEFVLTEPCDAAKFNESETVSDNFQYEKGVFYDSDSDDS